MFGTIVYGTHTHQCDIMNIHYAPLPLHTKGCDKRLGHFNIVP